MWLILVSSVTLKEKPLNLLRGVWYYVLKVFLKIKILFLNFNYVFLYHFHVMMSKIIFSNIHVN